MNTPGYDHEEVRCEVMADWDCDNTLVGSPRTCCVCIGHDCEEVREERKKHPVVQQLPYMGKPEDPPKKEQKAPYAVGTGTLTTPAKIREDWQE